MPINRDNLVLVPGYADLYVDKTDLRVYRCSSRGPDGLLEVIFRKSEKQHGYCAGLSHRNTLRRGRIIALALLPRPKSACHVEHINGDPYDDRLENLRWTVRKSYREYAKAWQNGRRFVAFEDGVQRWATEYVYSVLKRFPPRMRGEWKPEYNDQNFRFPGDKFIPPEFR